MKAAFVLIVFVSLSLAQNATTASPIAAGCGPANVRFDVKTDRHQHPLLQPEAGKAVLYFLQDDSQFLSHPRPTTRLGIDGEWVGATQSNSYFSVTLSPGVHHLCASWQSFVGLNVAQKSAAAHFTAEAGGVYFFLARNFWTDNKFGPARIEFAPVDSDQGQLLASGFGFSTSQPRK
jgi:hypothetical protein